MYVIVWVASDTENVVDWQTKLPHSPPPAGNPILAHTLLHVLFQSPQCPLPCHSHTFPRLLTELIDLLLAPGVTRALKSVVLLIPTRNHILASQLVDERPTRGRRR